MVITLEYIQASCTVLQSSALVDTPCWIWNGARDRKGYPKAGRLKVHREAVRLSGRSVDGLDAHHRCEVKACCNPEHLEPIGCYDHAKIHGFKIRQTASRRAHCKAGHELTAENTTRYGPEGRYRQCNACESERAALRWREHLLQRIENPDAAASVMAKKRASFRRWRAKNAEKMRAYYREYYAADPGKGKLRAKKFREANNDLVRARDRERYRRKRLQETAAA